MSTVYIIKNSDSDGYNQEFTRVPDYVGNDFADTWDYLQKAGEISGYLREGDLIYKCELVGKVEKQLIIKEIEK